MRRRSSDAIRTPRPRSRSLRAAWRATPTLLLAGLLLLASIACDGTPAGASSAETEDPATAPGDADEVATETGDTDTEAEGPGRKVETVAAHLGTVRDTLTLSTTLEALHTVDVPALVPGRVAEVCVREGATVEAGDPLLRLDRRDLELTARERELEHHDAVDRAATAELEHAEALSNEEVRRLAHDKAESVLARQERLLSELERRSVSEEALEESRFAVEEARIASANAALMTKRADVARRLAAIAVEKAQVRWDRAKLDLDRSDITAPIHGTVSALGLREGEQVTAGSKVGTIVDRSVLYCVVRVPQRRLGSFDLGQRVEIQAETHPGLSFVGTVEAILPVVDPIEGTVRVRVAVEDPEGISLPGAYISARVILSERSDALLVPKRARIFEGNRSYLFVVRDERAVRLEFTPGLLTEDEIEVLPRPDGLRPGEWVVVRGQSRLRDGDRVERVVPGEEEPLPADEPVEDAASSEAPVEGSAADSDEARTG